MRYYLVILFMSVSLLNAQQWAGPDKATCGELGVTIGSSDPCEGCCYLWSPATGLDDAKIKNPKALPASPTEYTVTVTGPNLQAKGSDKVMVDVEFGEMFFSPEHLIQSSDQTSDAGLLNLGDVNSPSEIAWTILTPTLGCTLVQQGLLAVISPGNHYGTITVQASKVGVPGCIVKGTLDINNGVKDVLAIDPDSPDRIAKAGQTLNVVDQSAVTIRAIPNPGGFSEGTPDWKQDAYGSNKPGYEVEEATMSEPHGLTNNYAEYIAGDDPEFKPKTGVRRITNVQTTLPLNTGIGALFNLFKEVCKFRTNPGDESATPQHDCGDGVSFDFAEQSSNFALKKSIVERYNDPDTSYKFEVAIEGIYQATGRIYHPYFTKSFDFGIVSVCSEVYMGVDVPITFAMNIVQDSSQADPSWHVDNFQGKWGIKLLGGIKLEASAGGWDATGTAEFSISAESISEFQAVTGDLISYIEIKPASGTITGKVTKTEDGNQTFELEFPSKEIQVIDAIKTTPITIYSFY